MTTAATIEAVRIDPFDITNLYLNYTVKNESRFSQTKIRSVSLSLTFGVAPRK